MTDGKVKITREVDNSQELSALQRTIAAQDKVIDKMRLQKKEQRQIDADAEKMSQRMVAGAKAIAASLGLGGGVLGIQRLITAEMEKQADMQRKAAQTQITLAQAQATLRQNLVGTPEARIRKLTESQIPELSRMTNVSQSQLTIAMANAVSSSGGNIDAAVEAVRTAAQFGGHQPDSIGQMSAALLAMGQATGTQSGNVNLGLLSQIAQLSPIANASLQAKNIPPAVIGQLAYGSSAQTGGALFAALSLGAADVTGESSGTAAISLAQQLSEFKGTSALGNTRSRIAALQSNPRVASQFLGQASFEKKFGGVVSQLLTDPNSAIAKAYAQNLGVMSGADLGAVGQSAIQTVAGGRLSGVEMFQRGAETSLSTIESISPMEAGGAIATGTVQEAINTATKSSYIEDTIDKFFNSLANFIGGPESVMRRQSAGIEQQLKYTGGAMDQEAKVALIGIKTSIDKFLIAASENNKRDNAIGEPSSVASRTSGLAR